jgi:RNA polymerase sigma-70 factor (ECF subfamily)
MVTPVDPTAALVSVVRAERTGLVAHLVRRFGFDLAEESVDAAIEAALEQWPSGGTPTSPRGWLLAVAKRRAIDRVRHLTLAEAAHDELRHEALDIETDETSAFPDDRLRLVFTCCNPAIAREAQVALALRWLSGLSTEDVARAFCVPVATMAQRLTRAKSKIETAKIPYEVPETRELADRVSTVLEVVYAIFNEGYVATTGPSIERSDLAEEAVRLAELVTTLLPESVEARAMLALLLLVHARREARVDAEGELVSLEDQDRSRWSSARIERGKTLLASALADGPPTTYAIEAAIQALHDEAPTFAETDFGQIVELYRLLSTRTDAPVVRVNHAVAMAHVSGPEIALEELLRLETDDELRAHPALPAALAEMYRRTNRVDEAKNAYRRAIEATKNAAEKRFLERRLRAL